VRPRRLNNSIRNRSKAGGFTRRETHRDDVSERTASAMEPGHEPSLHFRRPDCLTLPVSIATRDEARGPEPGSSKYRPKSPRNSPVQYWGTSANMTTAASQELAEREGFELGRWLKEISKLLIRIASSVPSDPPNSPYLPPDLPPSSAEATCDEAILPVDHSRRPYRCQSTKPASRGILTPGWCGTIRAVKSVGGRSPGTRAPYI